MQVEARAKLNWYLRVAGRRPDGYHDLDMLNQRLALHDTLVIAPCDRPTLTVEGSPAVSAGADNLVLRAAQRLRAAAGCGQGAHIHLIKRIPAGAGLGGGSADAAAALLALNDFWGTGCTLTMLKQLGASLGADIPYCLEGGFRRVQGTGELLSGIGSAAPAYDLLVVKPEASLSTRDVFIAHAQAQQHAPLLDMQAMLDALHTGDFTGVRGRCGNSLQGAAVQLVPNIGCAIAQLYEHGAAFAQMTGAGSAVFGVFDRSELRDQAWARMQAQYDICIRTSTVPY